MTLDNSLLQQTFDNCHLISPHNTTKQHTIIAQFKLLRIYEIWIDPPPIRGKTLTGLKPASHPHTIHNLHYTTEKPLPQCSALSNILGLLACCQCQWLAQLSAQLISTFHIAVQLEISLFVQRSLWPLPFIHTWSTNFSLLYTIIINHLFRTHH